MPDPASNFKGKLMLQDLERLQSIQQGEDFFPVCGPGSINEVHTAPAMAD